MPQRLEPSFNVYSAPKTTAAAAKRSLCFNQRKSRSAATLKRPLIAALALVVLAMATQAPATATQAAAAAGKPNIVFIMVDDLGPEWISSYGAEDIQTPNIDKLAAGGMKFTNAYSMPQCTPTRATLLTGQYPFRHGWVNHWDVPRWGAGCHFDPKHNLSFARLLKKAGYATAIAGKWQINDFRLQPNILRQHGFDEWSMWTGYESQNPPSAERYWDAYVHTNSGSRAYKGKFGPDIYNDFLIDFMKRHRDEPHNDEPMLLYYPMALTHGPLVHTPLEPDAGARLDKHKAMVRYTDMLVGKLVDALDELKIRDRTIVIFTTDNGTSRGITGRMNGRAVRGGKASLTENGMREPFIVNGPGLVPAGVTTDTLTDFTDLLPTFVELAGAKLPEGVVIDGKSIAGVILGKKKDGPREWIMAMGFSPARLDGEGVRPAVDYANRVVQDKRYKIHVLGGKVAKLYDLKNDPGEESNLIDSTNAGHVAARERLAAVVETFPSKDGRPRYDPLPPQPWDLTVEESEKKSGFQR